MINEELIKYVKHMRGQGLSDDDIKKVLLGQDWPEREILSVLWYDLNAPDDIKKEASKKYRKSTRVLPLVILLAIFWFAALLYVRAWNPSWNPFPEPPHSTY
ncbi:MAG: hypothetical protein WDZ40_00135 [Candidatus Spechtbacterales bacterium]